MIAKPTSRNPGVVTRTLRCIIAAMLSAVTFGESVRAQAVAEVRPVLNATTLNGELELNGLMDESVWALVDSIPAVTQTEPVQGAAPTGRTVVAEYWCAARRSIHDRSARLPLAAQRLTGSHIRQLRTVRHGHANDRQQHSPALDIPPAGRSLHRVQPQHRDRLDRWRFESNQLLVKLQYAMLIEGEEQLD